MEKQKNNETRICTCCGRELSINCFHKKGNRNDAYCKKCRNKECRKKYRQKAAVDFLNRKSSAPRIEETTNPKLRMGMILAAKQRVREMYEQRYNKLKNKEGLWQE